MHDNSAVVGLQWGDEGKGKVVDYLAKDFGVVARFNGGNNAGHTVIIGDSTYKLRVLPSGILRDDIISVIGGGVALDLECLLREIDTLLTSGIAISPEKLMISENCHLVLPHHKQLDELYEIHYNIGTTKCGIGPCYEDKMARRGIRLGDILNENQLGDRIEKSLIHHNALRKGFGIEKIDCAQTLSQILYFKEKVAQYTFSTDEIQKKISGKRVLFEGAQGMLLDIDHGTYPFVSSSSTGSAGGCGIAAPPQSTIGVIKPYATRVGSGPFPTEQQNDIGRVLQDAGKEFGTVSGRARRCGWLDAVLTNHSISTANVSSLALTKLDILDSVRTIKVCTAYKIGNKKIRTCSANSTSDDRLVPEYTDIKGWECSTYGKNTWGSLPKQAQNFIKFIEDELHVPISIISTGPERDDIILR